jgi:hypothetical protein
MAPALVIETVESLCLCTRITPQHRHNFNPRRRAAIAVLPSPCCRFRRLTGSGSLISEGRSSTSGRRGDRGIAAAVMAALAPWAHPPTRCAQAGAALAASDREGFDACGEDEDRGEHPARDGNNAATGCSRRVAAPCPHQQQLRGLDAAHS